MPVERTGRRRTAAYEPAWVLQRRTWCRVRRSPLHAGSVRRVTLCHMAGKQRQDEKIHVTVRLPRDLVARLQKRADQEGVERSQVIRALLDEGLRRRPSSRDRLKQIHDEVRLLREEVAAMKKRSRR